jgi:hypothetical protein
MFFMVIERFKPAATKAIGERFARQGRMLPDGVVYHASWIDAAGGRCFQIMESPSTELLNVWTSRWNDLVEFEIIPVVTSGEYWASMRENS